MNDNDILILKAAEQDGLFATEAPLLVFARRMLETGRRRGLAEAINYAQGIDPFIAILASPTARRNELVSRIVRSFASNDIGYRETIRLTAELLGVPLKDVERMVTGLRIRDVPTEPAPPPPRPVENTWPPIVQEDVEDGGWKR